MLDKLHRFERLIKVIGKDDFLEISKKCVLVLGVGGVGGYVCESLARSGVGTLIIVDFDTIDESNINRQIIALESTIGMKKVDALEQRIKEINSECKVIKIDKFIGEGEIDELFNFDIDFFVDACDTISTKKAIIKECVMRNINLISSMGTGNKLDSSKLEIMDLRKTVNDPLAKIMRKFIKDEKINKKIMVLSSSELPVKTGERTPGSTAFVPAAAGLLIGSYIVREFINKSK